MELPIATERGVKFMACLSKSTSEEASYHIFHFSSDCSQIANDGNNVTTGQTAKKVGSSQGPHRVSIQVSGQIQLHKFHQLLIEFP